MYDKVNKRFCKYLLFIEPWKGVKILIENKKLNIEYVSIPLLKPADYNPRIWDSSAAGKLTESIKRFGLVDPLIVNSAQGRKNIIIGGHFRFEIAKKARNKKDSCSLCKHTRYRQGKRAEPAFKQKYRPMGL